MTKTVEIGAHFGRPLRIVVWAGLLALLCLPAVAMLFTNEVAWTATDFVVMGAILAAAGGAYELGLRLSPHPSYRLGAVVSIIGAFLTVWINLAVGMIGSENDPANCLFIGVLAVGAIGAVLVRFTARGMARAMLATAATQSAIAGYCALARPDAPVGLVAAFAIPWLLAAWLFQRAPNVRPRPEEAL
ncbi:MAG: hypothetical protein EOP94_00090 [Zymomonas sp.]|nr:MAG: hypothetical protein EOP94_00090 [Zymomonas sp.]